MTDSPPSGDDCIGKLPDHLLVDILTRVHVLEWRKLTCVRKQWAQLFREECFWHAALTRTFPVADQAKSWPGPIPQGSSRRRYFALQVNKNILSLGGDIDEIVGHAYLFLKEHLEHSAMPPPSGILHGTIIDQLFSCGKSREEAFELASLIWLAVLNNLEENQKTFLVLKRLALEPVVFLPFPYGRSPKVQWKIFDRLFTDFRDCFDPVDYYDFLACAKNNFPQIPSTWSGY